MFNLQLICKTANALTKVGHSRSQAFVLAWVMAKGMNSKVAGVTHGKRQTALQRLLQYDPAEVSVHLHREPENLYDANATAVIVSVHGRGAYKMGYLPSPIATVIAPLIDTGKVIQSMYQAVKGGYLPGMNYGLAIQIRI